MMMLVNDPKLLLFILLLTDVIIHRSVGQLLRRPAELDEYHHHQQQQQREDHTMANGSGGGGGGGGGGVPKFLLSKYDYSFDQFQRDFRKSYRDDDADELEHRRRIFEHNLDTIVHHNQNRRVDHEHFLGVNRFMDLTVEELPKGLYTAHNKLNNNNAIDINRHQRRLIQQEASSSSHSIEDLPFDVSPVDELPPSVDWRSIATPVKDQGGCGSCWAFASTAALESHIAIQTKKHYSLSPQQLVSCVTNPRHCGGTGGCAGATGELAYEYLASNDGMVQEWEYGYQSYHGLNPSCPYANNSTRYHNRSPRYLASEAVVSLKGYTSLPINNYTVMMNAVAKHGPVAISVACNDWQFYAGGVFVDTYAWTRNMSISWDVNHLVVLEGYGTTEDGIDYWLVRNSWSPAWGEDGYIRLWRVDPATLKNPDGICGLDITPEDGDACTRDDSGNHSVIPPPQKVCGTSAVFFSGVIPVGGALI